MVLGVGDMDSVGVFSKLSLPLVSRSYPKLIADALVGVQPMSTPSSLIFYIRYRYKLGQTVLGSFRMRFRGVWRSCDVRLVPGFDYEVPGCIPQFLVDLYYEYDDVTFLVVFDKRVVVSTSNNPKYGVGSLRGSERCNLFRHVRRVLRRGCEISVV